MVDISKLAGVIQHGSVKSLSKKHLSNNKNKKRHKSKKRDKDDGDDVINHIDEYV